MVEVVIKSDPVRYIWFTSDDAQNPLSNEGQRWRISGRSYAWRPPTDVYETDEAVIVRVEIAGMDEADFSISLVDRNLIVRGIRQEINEKRAFHQMEIPFGEFNIELELPSPIITDEVEAVYRDGFLRIILPKQRPQHIQIGS